MSLSRFFNLFTMFNKQQNSAIFDGAEQVKNIKLYSGQEKNPKKHNISNNVINNCVNDMQRSINYLYINDGTPLSDLFPNKAACSKDTLSRLFQALFYGESNPAEPPHQAEDLAPQDLELYQNLSNFLCHYFHQGALGYTLPIMLVSAFNEDKTQSVSKKSMLKNGDVLSDDNLTRQVEIKFDRKSGELKILEKLICKQLTNKNGEKKNFKQELINASIQYQIPLKNSPTLKVLNESLLHDGFITLPIKWVQGYDFKFGPLLQINRSNQTMKERTRSDTSVKQEKGTNSRTSPKPHRSTTLFLPFTRTSASKHYNKISYRSY